MNSLIPSFPQIKIRILSRKRRYFRLAILSALLLAYAFSLPRKLFDKPACTVIDDREGRLLGAKIADDGQWRFPATDSVPYKYTRALVLFEDKRFYRHPGFDPIALGRALKQNISTGHVASGGSTITMQVIRMMQDNPPRNVLQKIRELILATRLELRCSKDEILNLYAANAPFGGNIVGIGAASWRYFGREPDELSWAEAVTLAILPNAPSLIHPGRNRERLLDKRNRLLDRLFDEGIISGETCSLARDEPLPDKPLPLPNDAPHLLDRIAAAQKGKRIKTTIDRSLQLRVNRIVQQHAALYRSNYVYNMAIVAAEAVTGDITAYVGNVYDQDNTAHGNRVDVIMAPRSTGSILKPLLYAAMLDQGELLPNMLVADVPLQIRNFAPRNFSRTYDGAVPAHRALERSLNVPSVRMLQNYGNEKFHLLLRTLGMTTLTKPADHYGLTLILGGAEGSLWDITGIYAGLSRQLQRYIELSGMYDPAGHHPLNFYALQSTRHHPKTPDSRLEATAPVEAAAIWQTFQSLSELNRPEEEASWKSFSSSRKVAWKTGTSFGHRDAWAVGVTPAYVVGVWVGNASGEGRPTLTGVNYAAPVLFDVFAQLPHGSWFSAPFDDMTQLAVCRKSGHRASMICDEVDTVWVARGGVETDPCPYHTMIHLSRDLKYRVNSECSRIDDMVHLPWFVLPPAQEWYYKMKNADYKPLPPIHPDCISSEGQRQMELIYPQQSLTVVLPRQLDGSPGQVVFRAAHRRKGAVIFWHVDNRFIGSTESPHQMPAAPAAGTHRLTLADDAGNTVTETFTVEEAEKGRGKTTSFILFIYLRIRDGKRSCAVRKRKRRKAHMRNGIT
ncbi:MAG: penicillin-binding protein 1C [Bacteroidales bacterium]|nr:penicillin-binding protein 1C [Bacteroidales bacterium]